MYDGLEHYAKIRAELVRIYNIITTKPYAVIAPRSVFLTTEQLESLEKNPPVSGLFRFSRVIETYVTIEKIIKAYHLGDDDFELGFARPSRDIPEVYELLQEYVRLWIDVKLNTYNYGTASIDELKAIEKVTRNLFHPYRHYYREKVRGEMNGKGDVETLGLDNFFIAMLKYGQEGPDDISYVSYVDQYQDRLNSRSHEMGVYMDAHKYLEIEKHSVPKLIPVPKKHSAMGDWDKYE